MKKAVVTILVLAVLGTGGYFAYRHFFAGGGPGADGRVSSTSEDAVHVDSLAMILGIGAGNGLTDRYGGETVAQATLEVKLDSERKVEECFVKEGDVVKEGDELFVYDTQEDEDKLAQAEIDIERDEGEIETSKRSIQENERLRSQASSEDQLIYTTTILQEENSIKQNEYDIKTKEREIEQLKEAIENSTVTAEMGGIIQKINDSDSSSGGYYGYDSGDSSAYITILADGDFRIEGRVNEQNMQNIYEGMPMIVFSRIDESVRWYGMISEIDTSSAVEDSDNEYMYYGDSGADSSTYKFYVELDSSEGLMLGQHVYMEADVGQEDAKEGLWLEEYYVTGEGDEAYVWCASEKNLLEKRKVTLGEYDEAQMKYEILEGLDEEDYIAYPMDTYEEGMPVVYNDIGTDEDDGMSGMEDFDMSGMDGMEGLDMSGMDGMDGLDMEGMDGADDLGSGEEYDGMDEYGDIGAYIPEEEIGAAEPFYDADADEAGADEADEAGGGVSYYDADLDMVVNGDEAP